LVRRFAAYLNANGVDVPVIPVGLLSARKPRAVPFIYSQDDLDLAFRTSEGGFEPPTHLPVADGWHSQ
ncbi:MAG: hypothetical protein M0032_10445, partial [Actinomycetota bacterium]|nr:hypothetical protein [Actinomycetota bacterium]